MLLKRHRTFRISKRSYSHAKHFNLIQRFKISQDLLAKTSKKRHWSYKYEHRERSKGIFFIIDSNIHLQVKLAEAPKPSDLSWTFASHLELDLWNLERQRENFKPISFKWLNKTFSRQFHMSQSSDTYYIKRSEYNQNPHHWHCILLHLQLRLNPITKIKDSTKFKV